MTSIYMRFDLKSDATFGRGDGIPGLVDQEVALDQMGCPYLHGRTLKGLLSEVCADLLFVLPDQSGTWRQAADTLFGVPGSMSANKGIMHVGHARLPEDIRNAFEAEMAAKRWSRTDILSALSAIRRQTAIEVDGVPDPHTLRAVRVILRKTPFEARISFDNKLDKWNKALLAAITLGFRRAGTARNRGRGQLAARLYDKAHEDITQDWFNLFQKEVCQ